MTYYNKLINWYFRREALPYWYIILFDSTICALSGILIIGYFTESHYLSLQWFPFLSTLIVLGILNLIGFRIFHTYSGIFRYSSFVDLKRVFYALLLSGFLAWLIHFGIFNGHYDSYFIKLTTKEIIGIYMFNLVGMCGLRVIVKNLYEIAFVNKNSKVAFIYGVKSGGVNIAKNIRNEKPARFKLKGFISDDKDISDRYLMGEKIYAIDDNLENILDNYGVQVMLVSHLKVEDFRNNQEFQDLLIKKGIKIYLSNRVKEWDYNNDSFDTTQLREVSIEDLLPRDEIQVDMLAVEKMLTGKKILITGSAGSIGSEIVRQIAVYKPAKMMLIDQAETPQHDIRLIMKNEYPDIKSETIVTSITNKKRMDAIFNQFHPNYVFHAAAYKHVPMMEDNPSESILNNVEGTKILADLSVKYGVKKFVMISTDKAVNPTNVMGCSKRICEIYVQSLDKALKEKHIKIENGEVAYAEEGDENLQTQFVTTRFGNVLGSNGSVIPLFKKQIKEGGPITVTDPNIIRYFMLIPEACKLVLEAGTMGKGGEIFIFDMGKPVKIADLAKRMIYLSGAKNVEIKYTGLRAGEKLYEEVLNVEETTKPSFNKKIRIATVRDYNYDDACKSIQKLFDVSLNYDDMETVRIMKEIVPEYKSNNSVYSTLD